MHGKESLPFRGNVCCKQRRLQEWQQEAFSLAGSKKERKISLRMGQEMTSTSAADDTLTCHRFDVIAGKLHLTVEANSGETHERTRSDDMTCR